MPKRYTIEDMQAYVINYGGKCLSKEYINASTPLKWRCEKGHTWEADFQIIRQGGWCPQCAKRNRKEQVLEDIKVIVAKRGFKCLSTEYINDSTKLQFQCAENHIWMATPNNIKNGRWCRKCSYIERTDKQRDVIGTYQKIAEKRGGKCLSAEYIHSHKKLEFQCSEKHKWSAIAIDVKRGSWCPKCAHKLNGLKQRDSIETFYKIALERGGKCLSTKYITSETKLLFQCSEGHQWNASPSHIKNGRWCRICAYKRVKEKLKNNIKKY